MKDIALKERLKESTIDECSPYVAMNSSVFTGSGIYNSKIQSHNMRRVSVMPYDGSEQEVFQ